jgi:hypothetical protein
MIAEDRKPFLTTREAADYCGFKTSGALRKAKLEGHIMPHGRRGGRGTLSNRSGEWLSGRDESCELIAHDDHDESRGPVRAD